MNERISSLAGRIRALEHELAEAIHEQEDKALYTLKGRKVEFDRSVRQVQARMKIGIFRFFRTSRPQNVLSTPVIYGMVVPLAFLDLSVSMYQLICFPLFGIARVHRADYIAMDRHKLPYLNFIEKINCDYCSYANGLIAYVREVLARTEQYWCPVKHARMLRDEHVRSRGFIPYGKADGFHTGWEAQRKDLRQEGKA